jgi:hypothetical protein
MRFSYCESLIEKKSFFIFKIEYFFENEFNTVLLRQYGLSKFFLFFSYMIFEFHNSHLHITKTFFEIGIGRSRNFAKLLLYFYQPHLNIKDYFFFNLVRFMKPSTLRGKNMIAGLPTHGQRSHSNRKSILRFRSYLSNYISNMSMVNFSRYVRKIKISAYKHKDTPVVKTKKKTTKNLAKSSGNKKPKKKKLNV